MDWARGGYIWRRFASAIKDLYRPLTIDLRGHGESEWDPDRCYTLQTYVEDVASVLDAYGANGVTLVGHSLGGEIAIHIALAYPGRVRKLVVSEFGPSLNKSGLIRLAHDLDAQERVYRSVDEYACWLKAKRPLTSPDLLRYLAQVSLRPDLRGILDMSRICGRYSARFHVQCLSYVVSLRQYCRSVWRNG